MNCCYAYNTTQSVPKVMRMIFLCSAEGPGKESGRSKAGGGGTQVYSLTFLSWVRAFVAVGTLAKCVVVFVSCQGRKCRGVWSSVNATQVLHVTWKIWFRNIAAVEDSLWGCCFVFHPSLQVAQGVQVRKEERWGRKACRPSFNCKNWEQCGSCEDCSG